MTPIYSRIIKVRMKLQNRVSRKFEKQFHYEVLGALERGLFTQLYGVYNGNIIDQIEELQ